MTATHWVMLLLYLAIVLPVCAGVGQMIYNDYREHFHSDKDDDK